MIFWQIIGGRLVEVEIIDRRPLVAAGKKHLRKLVETYKRRVKRVIEIPCEVVELGTRPIGSRGRFRRARGSRGTR